MHKRRKNIHCKRCTSAQAPPLRAMCGPILLTTTYPINCLTCLNSQSLLVIQEGHPLSLVSLTFQPCKHLFGLPCHKLLTFESLINAGRLDKYIRLIWTQIHFQTQIQTQQSPRSFGIRVYNYLRMRSGKSWDSVGVRTNWGWVTSEAYLAILRKGR